ncbi:4052_t:CDS:2 [Gigaspora margarita]|uniref:4052_t:CDS:1 n=1 Tax=Gigaspora margarita TaxID=4874 RepID=A0ABN7VZV1_GIGMA|nr:4052_t:CDS:2 [Gigaspora margarita]
MSTDLLARSFEVARLILNSDGSKDNKITNHLQTILANHMNEIVFFEKEDNGPSNQNNVNNESNPNNELDNEHDNELYSENMLLNIIEVELNNKNVINDINKLDSTWLKYGIIFGIEYK